MARVPLDVAATICGVKPGTIYRWVSDRRITTEPIWDEAVGDWRNGYDIHELLTWIDSRNPDALRTRAGMGGDHATRLARVAVAKRNHNRVSSAPDQCA